MSPKTIEVDYLARVEGEGGLTIRFRGREPEEVKLRIFEPPRFFEALLRGRSQMEVPDITARICGICPIAYMMSACNAIEDALGIEVPEGHHALRRLIYCGEWIESHALHVFMLHAPDFLGYPDALAMAKDHRDLVQRGLRMKKAGNALMTLIGGREIHPINVRVGGFYKVPSRAELRSLVPELQWGRQAARETLAWMSTLTFPEFERDYEFVAMSHPEEYPIARGRICSNKGLDITARDYDEHFTEEQVPHSTALHSRLKARGAYFCGPLARFNLTSIDFPTSRARPRSRQGSRFHATTPSRDCSCGRWRSFTRSMRPSGSSKDTKSPKGPSSMSPRAQPGATAAPRLLAEFSITVTRSMNAGSSRVPKSSHPRRKTRRRSKRTCSRWPPPSPRSHTERRRSGLNMPYATTIRASRVRPTFSSFASNESE